ncbi:hypothetical protein B0H12DRAFT_1135940 [Mycena haematopus]|nr:hypothetical protein B0H12DRAFT_1135940 [Mycena haematopus]
MTPDSSNGHQTVDMKRKSGKAPCAECKRLKLKCDKNIPCASCVRRGCGDTCPNGTYFPTGRGRRAVPTEASRARRAFTEMQARIRELETAITRANNYHLDVCPLLGISKDPSIDQLADSLGSLSCTETGNFQYYGPTAGTEALLSIEVLDELDADKVPLTFVAMTASFGVGFRGTPAWDPDHALVQLLACLPAQSRASELVDIYFENGCWSGTPIMCDELLELLSLVYEDIGTAEDGPAFPPRCSVHQIAVIYGAFALGALVDLALPSYNAESEHYFDLCRAALSVVSVFDYPSVAAIQALVLVSIFFSHGGPRFSMDGAWTVISLASNLCQSMGLHSGRVPSGMAPKQVRRRRALFWETYAIETLQSLVLGRPTGTCLASISCPFPDNDGQQMDVVPRFYLRRWQFIKEVAAPVLETHLTAQAPNYDVIVQLDQRIRKFMHSALRPDDPQFGDDQGSPAAYMRRQAIPQTCRIMLMSIHNHAFVRAMRENPNDPYYTVHASSFLAALRCASEMIRAHIDNFRRHAQLFERWWPTWEGLFNAAMVVGAIAAKCPQISYGPQALLELFVAIEMFERGASTCYRARAGLTILHKLRAKAISAYAVENSTHSRAGTAEDNTDADPELDVFAGRTSYILARTIIARNHQAHTPIIKKNSSGMGANARTMADSEAGAIQNFQLEWDGDGISHLRQGQAPLSPVLVEYFSSQPELGFTMNESGYAADTSASECSFHPHDGSPLTLFDLGAPILAGRDDSWTGYDIIQPFLDSES